MGGTGDPASLLPSPQGSVMRRRRLGLAGGAGCVPHLLELIGEPRDLAGQAVDFLPLPGDRLVELLDGAVLIGHPHFQRFDACGDGRTFGHGWLPFGGYWGGATMLPEAGEIKARGGAPAGFLLRTKSAI